MTNDFIINRYFEPDYSSMVARIHNKSGRCVMIPCQPLFINNCPEILPLSYFMTDTIENEWPRFAAKKVEQMSIKIDQNYSMNLR